MVSSEKYHLVFHQFDEITWSLTELRVKINVNLGKYKNVISLNSVKRKCHHFDEICIIGCTESCLSGNFQLKWQHFHSSIAVQLNHSRDIFCKTLIIHIPYIWYVWQIWELKFRSIAYNNHYHILHSVVLDHTIMKSNSIKIYHIMWLQICKRSANISCI